MKSFFDTSINFENLQDHLMENALVASENALLIIKKDPQLNELMDEYITTNPHMREHLTLVSLFSNLICQNLSWSGKQAKETVALGCLLHDIGSLKLPDEIRTKALKDMSAEEMKIYHQHPMRGHEMLANHKIANEQVRQIIYQHHEVNSGAGFPNKLSGQKIYPLAKIVGFAEKFADILITQKISPLCGLKVMLNDREMHANYDASLFKALATAFNLKK